MSEMKPAGSDEMGKMKEGVKGGEAIQKQTTQRKVQWRERQMLGGKK